MGYSVGSLSPRMSRFLARLVICLPIVFRRLQSASSPIIFLRCCPLTYAYWDPSFSKSGPFPHPRTACVVRAPGVKPCLMSLMGPQDYILSELTAILASETDEIFSADRKFRRECYSIDAEMTLVRDVGTEQPRSWLLVRLSQVYSCVAPDLPV